ncbi:MAG: hypothetical protein KC588_16765 [Nitrospira sp.]|nr:hypothetical protein [Nitrospira sp.]
MLALGVECSGLEFSIQMCVAIEMSDDTQALPASGGPEKFYNCVWLVVTPVVLILTHATDEKLLENMDLAESPSGVALLVLAMILKQVKKALRETEMLLLDMNSHSEANLLQLTEQARALLSCRHVQ